MHARLALNLQIPLIMLTPFVIMNNMRLEEVMDRAERALLRIEHMAKRGVITSSNEQPSDEKLRSRVVEALSELDLIIREAGH